MSTTSTLNIASPERMSPMVAQLISDLSELLDCKWAIAMGAPELGLRPLFTVGRNSNPLACAEETTRVLAGQIAPAEPTPALFMLPDGTAPEWMPRIVCQLRAKAEVLAVVALGPKSPAGEYSHSDVDLVRTYIATFSIFLSDERLTPKLGRRIAWLRRARREIETAREVQRRFLPGNLTGIAGLDYYGQSEPIGEVGGDFVDFISVGNSSLLLSIGDVSGKGVASGMIMAAVQGSLRALGSSMSFNVVDLVDNLNRVVWQLTPDNFYVTMFCARVDVDTQEMHYVNAGHDRAVLLRTDKKRALILASTGPVLGQAERTVFRQRTIRLEPGDTLVAVTDGITEPADFNGNGFDRELLAGMREHANGSARDLAEYIFQVAQQHNGDVEPLLDDRTVVVVRRSQEMLRAAFNVPAPIRRRASLRAAA